MGIDNLERFILGETEEEFICVDEQENQQVAVSMLQQAEYHLDILSRDLDPVIYDTLEYCDQLEELALRSRHSRIRILLHNPKKAAQRGHSIIHLAKRLGSLIQIRALAEVHKSISDTFMIVDGIGIMHRPHIDTLAAYVNFKDRPKAKQWLQLFEKTWISAEPDPDCYQMIL